MDLISIGDASLDAFINPVESEVLCSLKEQDCMVCFSFGDKIPVRDLQFSVGGNAANNAVGASRLGVKASIVLSLGIDPVGKQIIDTLGSEGVDISNVIQQPGTVSNYSTIVNYSGERTIFTFHAPRVYTFPPQLSPAPWVYLTSMGEGFAPFYAKVLEWLAKNTEVKLAFNPGSWQLKAGREGLAEVLSKTYVLFVNREEAEKLTGLSDSHGKEKDLLVSLSKLGVKMPVVTDGEGGSYIFDGTKFVHAGILPIDAYERTGAGDAFGSGCLSAIIQGKSLEEALVWGTLNSTSVIGYIGSQKGLLRQEEIPVWEERAKSSGMTVSEI